MGENKASRPRQELLEKLRELLLEGKAHTQDQLCSILQRQGFNVNQSKLSRLLRALNAVKIKNAMEQVVYTLPKESVPVAASNPIGELILDITYNESLIIISTCPGAASMIARLLDYHRQTSEILGTVAGDDTIFVAPKSSKNIKKTLKEVRQLLG